MNLLPWEPFSWARTHSDRLRHPFRVCVFPGPPGWNTNGTGRKQESKRRQSDIAYPAWHVHQGGGTRDGGVEVEKESPGVGRRLAAGKGGVSEGADARSAAAAGNQKTAEVYEDMINLNNFRNYK